MGGFWKFHRDLISWHDGIFMKGNNARVICHILNSVVYEEKEYKGVMLKPGQFTTSLDHIAKHCNLTKSSTRYALNVLEMCTLIERETTPQYTKITVVNWEKYQGDARFVHDSRTIRARSVTPNKEIRNKNKEIIHSNFFKDDELNKWLGVVTQGILKNWSRFNPDTLEEIAKDAMNWQQSTGKKYKSIPLFLNNWFKKSEKYKQMEHDYNFNNFFEKIEGDQSE